MSALKRLRSVSWLFAAKCFTEAPTPSLWIPVTHAVPNAAAKIGSSE